MKANIGKAIAYLAALSIKVKRSDVVFNEDGEITFTSTQDSKPLIDSLGVEVKPVSVDYGYTTFNCGPGFLTIQGVGKLGSSITLSVSV